MPRIPFLNVELAELRDYLWNRSQEPKTQRRLILVIVCIALLLDNMLYMVIVPIIPDYLRHIGAWDTHMEGEVIRTSKMAPPIIRITGMNKTGLAIANVTAKPLVTGHMVYEGENAAIGFLFASKALVQLMVNPFSGHTIDRIGYDIPMMIGLTIMFFSTAVFACGRSYTVLFFARSLQGVGSAFADTAGLAMIADRFTEEAERTKALGIALAFISFGCLVAPPFGGLLYDAAGKEVPFLILAFVSLIDGCMLLLVMKPIKQQMSDAGIERPAGTPIHTLLMDPYIAICAGALMMSNVALAFLEPTITVWMIDNLHTEQWQVGMIWLPAFIPHVVGVVITVKMAREYPQYQWAMAAGGLALEGLCCFIIPFSKSYWVLMLPICGICFGIALIDTALLPTLGYLVDVRYVSVYGSIYAIADISYSFAYAFGPIVAGAVVETIGFVALNIGIGIVNLMYVPLLMVLRHIYDYKPVNEAGLMMGDPPDKRFQVFAMHGSQPGGQRSAGPEIRNHSQYGRLEEDTSPVRETVISESKVQQANGNPGWAAYPEQNQTAQTRQQTNDWGTPQTQSYQDQQPTYQQQQPGYPQQQGQRPYQQQPQPVQPQQQQQYSSTNPFTQGFDLK